MLRTGGTRDVDIEVKGGRRKYRGIYANIGRYEQKTSHSVCLVRGKFRMQINSRIFCPYYSVDELHFLNNA